MIRKIGTILAVFFLILGTGNGIRDGYCTEANSGEKQFLPPRSFADLAVREKEYVVNISTTKIIKRNRPHMRFYKKRFPSPYGNKEEKEMPPGFEDFFDRFFGEMPHHGNMRERSLGSGFIIDKEGYVLTNYHVIEGADEIIITLSNEKSFDGKVVGTDKKTDLALVKIEVDNHLPTASLGDSDKLRVGDWVVAIGNPFGLEHTVTAGIVSAKGRVIGAGPYDDFIQTDASINPGNSGGPLFNLAGEVVGINTAIVATGQGIGFAIPINLAKEILPQMKEKGKVIRGWLGLLIQHVTPEIASALKLEKPEGALVADVVSDSPAEKAEIKRGDVIVEFDGKKVKTESHLSRMAASTKVGKKTIVKLVRDGKLTELEVNIGQYPDEEGEKGGIKAEKTLGMDVQNLTPELADTLGFDPEEKGVLVSDVEIGGPAEKAGLRQGDLIIELNHQPLKSANQFKKRVEKLKKGESALILLRRGPNTLFVALKME